MRRETTPNLNQLPRLQKFIMIKFGIVSRLFYLSGIKKARGERALWAYLVSSDFEVPRTRTLLSSSRSSRMIL